MNPSPILHSALDHFTAEKMLSGPLAPEDAPPGYGKVAALLRAAAAAPEEEPEANPDKQRATVAAMVAVITDSMSARWSFASRRRGAKSRSRVRILAALVTATMMLGTGLAFAGALPGPAQNAAAKMLAKFGVTVPGDPGVGTATPPKTPKQGQGPDVNGPAKYGLCNAYASGQGGQNGNKNNAVPFQNLQRAATGAGQTIEEFCAGATPGGRTEGTSGSPIGKGQGNHGKSGKSGGAANANGQANGEGKGSGASKKDAPSPSP
jgi:hypothetical protein